MQTFLFIISWLMFGAATAYFAKQRGRDPTIWFLIGTFFGILGLIFVFILPAIKPEEGSAGGEALLPDEKALSQLPHHDYAIKEWYYYDAQKQRIGPISFNDLKVRWTDAAITLESYVWSDGMSDWKPLKDVPDLLEHLQAPV